MRDGRKINLLPIDSADTTLTSNREDLISSKEYDTLVRKSIKISTSTILDKSSVFSSTSSGSDEILERYEADLLERIRISITQNTRCYYTIH